MQVLAIGKWSKADKRWKMVVALHRPAGSPPATPAAAGRRTARPTPLKGPSK